jgi:hypothetical protein
MTQLTMGLRWSLGVLVAMGIWMIPPGAESQEAPSRAGDFTAPGRAVELLPGRRTFGIADEVVKTYDAWTFNGDFNGSLDTGLGGVNGSSLRTGFTSSVGIDLPTGAQLLRLELDACDESDLSEVIIEFYRATTPAGTGLSRLVMAGTGALAEPGCQVFEIPVPGGPIEVNNAQEHYFLIVSTGGPTFTAGFSAVRVFYRLQVSPAPAVATFSDVPTSHPFFRFIEALARSGITSGCGGGNFCPDAPLTRGQMAVFLSLGLGLHFAP